MKAKLKVGDQITVTPANGSAPALCTVSAVNQRPLGLGFDYFARTGAIVRPQVLRIVLGLDGNWYEFSHHD